MGDTKFLDYGGLSRFWNKVDEKKQDRLTIDTELDSTSHNPVENMAIKFAIDNLNADISDSTSDSNTFLYQLYNQVMPYVGTDEVTNTVTSTCYCLVHGLTVTIYFNIEGNYGSSLFPIPTVIPSNCRPFVDIANLVAKSESGFNNISINAATGQIFITSNDGIYSTHCAMTYLIMPANISIDPNPAEEDSKYSVSARMIKIGDYLPVYSNGSLGGQAVRGAALVTDAAGTVFSGYEGNYTVYLQDGYSTSPGALTEQFYWNKKVDQEINSSGQGSLFTFDQCFEAASGNISESDLIEKGIEAITTLVDTEDTIQYFVTGFGKNSWVGGINKGTVENAAIKNKAYGNTEGAGGYSGRYYWTQTVLAHIFRFIPISAEEYISDKSHPIEQSGTVVGYIDKIIPLKLIEQAYSWGGFEYKNGSTWRGVKLFCENIETLSSEILDQIFTGHLVIEDWNNNSTTGNKFGNLSSYYQRIDSKLTENQSNNTSTIVQTPVYKRPNNSWEKTSYSLEAYTGSEFE